MKLLQWFFDRKALIFAGTVGQAFVWIPIVLLPLAFPEWGPWLVVIGAAAYCACAQFTTPAWNSLIADWLHQHERGACFAHRAKIIAGLSFFALCGAGWALSLWQHSSAAWWGFVLIFTLAGSARILSVLALSPVQDVHPTAHREVPQGFRGFVRQNATKDFRLFLLFSGLMHASVLVHAHFSSCTCCKIFTCHTSATEDGWPPAFSVNFLPCRPGAISGTALETKRYYPSPASQCHSCQCSTL